MAPTAEWLQLLRRVFLFSSFTGTQLALLSRKMTLVSYPKGALLFRENDPGDSLYIIVSGTVRVLKNGVAPTDPDSKDSTQAYLNRGDVLGEMALLASEPRSNTAVVDATADLLVLYKRDFDVVLEKNPSLAVHLSRVLSSRLASIHRTGAPAPQPAKIFAVLNAVPLHDQVLFAINLGVALVEQTRRRVLLCAVDSGEHLLARSLGLDGPHVTEDNIRSGFLQDPDKFERVVLEHPSGLELVQLDQRVLGGSLNTVLYPFFSLIKDTYDYCLFVLPAALDENAAPLLTDSDRILVVSGPQSQAEDLAAIRKLEGFLGGKRTEKIWLSDDPGSQPPDFAPDMRFYWEAEWGRRFLSHGSPFFSHQALRAQRGMDRLARNLGQMVVGFAMGSGAAFGYALIGMLRVLEREGIFPDVIAGTSMGALIGSFYSAGIPPDQLEEIACSITKKRLRSLMDFSLPRTGLIRGNRILQFLRSHLGDRTFKDLLLPFSCVATDIQTGKEIVLDRGNVAEAVRASLSLPFFFQPYYLDGRYLVDGGLVNPVPTSITVQLGANVLISANLTSKASERRVPRMIGWWRRRLPSMMRGPSIPEVMIKTIYIMQYEVAQARSEIAHAVMEIKMHDLLWWDLDRAPEMIKMGEASAEEMIPKIKSLLPYFSDSCKIRLGRRGRKSY